MKIEALNICEAYPKIFNVTKSKKELGNDDTWLRNKIKWWCNFDAKERYRGFNWSVKSVRKLYQKPHFEVTFTNNKKMLFIIYQQR